MTEAPQTTPCGKSEDNNTSGSGRSATASASTLVALPFDNQNILNEALPNNTARSQVPMDPSLSQQGFPPAYMRELRPDPGAYSTYEGPFVGYRNYQPLEPFQDHSRQNSVLEPYHTCNCEHFPPWTSPYDLNYPAPIGQQSWDPYHSNTQPTFQYHDMGSAFPPDAALDGGHQRMDSMYPHQYFPPPNYGHVPTTMEEHWEPNEPTYDRRLAEAPDEWVLIGSASEQHFRTRQP
jgi:hypothetical protein